MTALVCATLAGLSAAVLSGPGPRHTLRARLRARLRPDQAPVLVGRGRWPVALPGRRRLLVPALACSAMFVVLASRGLSGLLLGLAAGVVTAGVGWLHAAGRRRREAERWRRRTVEVCDALAAEMRAGQPAIRALHRAAEEHPLLGPAARACALGGDVPGALRRAARGTPGTGGMSAVAAAWQVAEGSGSGLVLALQRVADTLRADEAAGAEVASSLSPARATARLLAVLPVFGLLLGMGLGGDPLSLLLSTPTGNALLLAGAALALAGTVWVERLAMRVES